MEGGGMIWVVGCRIMGAPQLCLAARLFRRTNGTEQPITGALLISTQRALCQKSDTVQALWTSSPFKSTQRAFYGLNRSAALFVWGSEGSLMDHEQRDSLHLQRLLLYCEQSLIETNMFWFSFTSAEALSCKCFTLDVYSGLILNKR